MRDAERVVEARPMEFGNEGIVAVYKDYLSVVQGHQEAAALLTLTQCLLEATGGNCLADELATGIKAGLTGGFVVAGSVDEKADQESSS